MKKILSVLMVLLSAAVIFSVAVLVPAAKMSQEQLNLSNEAEELEEDDGEDFGDLLGKTAPGGFSVLDLLFPAAAAEETVEAVEEKDYTLSMDLYTPGNKPLSTGYYYDEDGNVTRYRDDSIEVELETRYDEEKQVSWRIARVQIKSPTQLRTAVASSKVTGDRTAIPTRLAAKYNAVVAINGDDYQNGKDAKSFEVRMGEKARTKTNTKRDLLIIDENADLHIFVKSNSNEIKAFLAEGHKAVQAFTFGPALVIDGEEQEIPKDYKYNPTQPEPRCAIGQTGPLSYVLVIAEGRGESNSKGVTVAQLAEFMCYDMMCQQAYNLDGGNSAEMVVGGKMYMDPKHTERDMNDILYFASAVTED